MKILFCIFLITTSLTQSSAAENIPANKMNAPTEDKGKLAKDFFDSTGMQEEVQRSFAFGDGYVSRLPKEKNPQIAAQNVKVYALAKTKWQKKKAALLPQLTQQVQNDIANAFSAAELKYLIEVSKSSAFKRYIDFLKSDSFGRFFSAGPQAAREAVEEARKEITQPAKPTPR